MKLRSVHPYHICNNIVTLVVPKPNYIEDVVKLKLTGDMEFINATGYQLISPKASKQFA